MINTTFQRNPDIDPGHRRLQLDGAIGVDHLNPASMTGKVQVGSVDFASEWAASRSEASNLLVNTFGPGASVDFVKIFSAEDCNILWPRREKGYVGINTELENDGRSEKEHTLPVEELVMVNDEADEGLDEETGNLDNAASEATLSQTQSHLVEAMTLGTAHHSEIAEVHDNTEVDVYIYTWTEKQRN